MDKTSTQHGGELVAAVLRAHGVRFVFTLVGGHISPILVACEKLGIRVVDTRHEVTTVFAADAVARLSGEGREWVRGCQYGVPLRGRAQLPGLCSRDGGCGCGHSRSWPHQHGDSCEECSDGSVPHLALGGRSQHYDPGTPGESLGACLELWVQLSGTMEGRSWTLRGCFGFWGAKS